MNEEKWACTRLGVVDPRMAEGARLDPGELPVVSSYLSDVSWSVLTSRRVIGAYFTHRVEVETKTVSATGFGNFKGYGGKGVEVLTMNCGDDREMRIEYETGAAAMAAMYYFKFWELKVPHLAALTG